MNGLVFKGSYESLMNHKFKKEMRILIRRMFVKKYIKEGRYKHIYHWKNAYFDTVTKCVVKGYFDQEFRIYINL